MKVIKINEECHGLIGIAANPESAQNYVIDSWLSGDLYTVIDDKDQTFEEAFGENWKEVLKELPFIIFTELLCGYIWFSEEEVIGSENK